VSGRSSNVNSGGSLGTPEYGVYGWRNPVPTEPGTYGYIASNDYAVYGKHKSGNEGYLGSSTEGVKGTSSNNEGVVGISNRGIGVKGYSYSSNGVYGESSRGVGVKGISSVSTGVVGQSTSGYAGHFSGGKGLFASKIEFGSDAFDDANSGFLLLAAKNGISCETVCSAHGSLLPYTVLKIDLSNNRLTSVDGRSTDGIRICFCE